MFRKNIVQKNEASIYVQYSSISRKVFKIIKLTRMKAIELLRYLHISEVVLCY
jgi:hypothetical protein